ncbi:TetR/AcrR family transcriptional regulator [Kineococcus sp. SYSU DK003]|uniref:TetR/AcrR family transcriptional regulator n=1 Tax=Kineococcus sp. SYSU DK003 TaxID=3383124 RepID=UPI003D7F1234
MAENRTTPRTRNPRGEGARLREEIVAAATTLLEQGSAAAVTLRAVARGAGITAPSIYRHFADVDAILRAVVDEAFEDFEHRMRAAGQQPDTAAGRLHAVCRCYLDFAHERPQRYHLMFGGAWNAAAGADEATRADRSHIGLNAFAALSDAVQGCVDAGVSASTDVFADTTALWVALHGLSGLRETTSLFPWPDDLAGNLVRTLARLT